MSSRSSSAVPPWATKLPSTYSSAADSTTSQGENSNDSLILEDLDLGNLEISPPSIRTYTASPDDTELGDYVIYPEIGGNNIFGEHIPEVVSEACLMNDLYILVKVPTNPARLVPTTTTGSQTSPKSPKLSPTLYLKSNRRIFAIKEEEEEHSVPETSSKIPVRTKSKTKKPCWDKDTDDLEEFSSTTNIIRCLETVPLPNQVPEQPPEEPRIQTSPKRVSNSPRCQNQIELQEVNFNSICLKGPGNVTLENYGILITPTKTPKSENLLVFQVDTEPKDNNREDNVSCFEWVTRCFRQRRRRNSYVHAKVYKTYFVKWKKHSEESKCARCKCRTHKKPRRNSA